MRLSIRRPSLIYPAAIAIVMISWGTGDAWAQRVIGCQNADLSSGPCRNGGGGSGGGGYHYNPGPSPAEIARQQRLQQAHDSNEEGRVLFAQGNYEAALAKFQAARQLNPNEAAYQRNISLAERAIERRRKIELGKRVHSVLSEGYALLDQKNYDGALAKFRAAERLDPNASYVRQSFSNLAIRRTNDQINSLEDQAHALEQHGDYRAAQEKWKALLTVLNAGDLRKQKAQGRIVLLDARIAEAAGNLDLAISKMREAAALDARLKNELLIFSHRLGKQAVELRRQGKYAEALKKDQVALSANPASTGLRGNIAWDESKIAESKGDLQLALAAAKKGAALNPEWEGFKNRVTYLQKQILTRETNALRVEAISLTQQGRYVEALAKDEAALALNPASKFLRANVALTRSRVAESNGDLELALEEAKKAAEVGGFKGRVAHVLTLQARSLRLQKKYAEALAKGQEALALDPANKVLAASVSFDRSRIAESNGDLKLAVEEAKKAAELNPEWKGYRDRIEYLEDPFNLRLQAQRVWYALDRQAGVGQKLADARRAIFGTTQAVDPKDAGLQAPEANPPATSKSILDRLKQMGGGLMSLGSGFENRADSIFGKEPRDVPAVPAPTDIQAEYTLAQQQRLNKDNKYREYQQQAQQAAKDYAESIAKRKAVEQQLAQTNDPTARGKLQVDLVHARTAEDKAKSAGVAAKVNADERARTIVGPPIYRNAAGEVVQNSLPPATASNALSGRRE